MLCINYNFSVVKTAFAAQRILQEAAASCRRCSIIFTAICVRVRGCVVRQRSINGHRKNIWPPRLCWKSCPVLWPCVVI